MEEARCLGDRLVVVVARDHNVERFKGFLPAQNEQTRRQAVVDSGLADEVLLGEDRGDLLAIVAKVAPDILAIGYDQALPDGLRATFPELEVKVLPAYEPHRHKSSLLRQQAS